jgi:L-iditol 2-dehydrogenase
LPSSLTFNEGALLEPLAVAIHAVRRAEVEKHSTCLVFGAGPVGLLCAAAARNQGCRRVLITDIDTGRVQFAIDSGFAEAGYVVQSQRGSTVEEKLAIAQELARQIGDVPWPDGTKAGKADNTFECTGVESCVQTSIFVRSPPFSFRFPSLSSWRNGALTEINLW